jgi:hypothetical protein
MNTTPNINVFDEVQSRLAQNRIPRYGPILALAARSILILLAQGLTFLSREVPV